MRALLDTSVVVRYLTRDPTHLFPASVRLIEGGDELVVTDVVVAETAHVLMSYYGASRSEVVDHLLALLHRTILKCSTFPKRSSSGHWRSASLLDACLFRTR